jgi:hypothetical protein
MSHKLTTSQDGNDRVELVVKARFTLLELATLITSNFVTETSGRNDAGEFLINMKTIKETLPNKKTAVSIAQEVVLIDGTVIPSYRISDNALEELRDQIFERLKQLWA